MDVLNRWTLGAARDAVSDRVRQHGLEPSNIDDMVILGSGLGNFAKDYMEGKIGDPSGPVAIPFANILEGHGTHSPDEGVSGHARQLIVGMLKGTDESRLVLAQSGREHPYEGVSTIRSTFWLRVAQMLGVKTLIGSNASGVLTPGTLTPPALMLVHSDQDFGDDNPLDGPNNERFGPRFPHMSDLYSERMRNIIKAVAERIGVDLKEGTYMRMKGPNYERPEDVYHLREQLGAMWYHGKQQPGDDRFEGDPVGVVGMSSTYEAMVAQHASQSRELPAFQDGKAWISVATNYSASLGPKGIVLPSNHGEVKENAAQVQEAFGKLVAETILEMRRRVDIAA